MTVKQVLESMADVESRIAVIYERFATEFRGAADVSDLWDSMGREEFRHADLLTRAAATADQHPGGAMLDEHLATLQQLLLAYERDQRRIASLQEALRLTADLEEAEATYLHRALRVDPSIAPLTQNPALEHRLRRVLEHAIQLYGTPAVKRHLAWQRSHN